MCLYPTSLWTDLTVHDIFYPLLIILVIYTFLVLAGIIVSVMTKKPSKMMVLIVLIAILTSISYSIYMIWAHDAAVLISSLSVVDLFLPLVVSWIIGVLLGMLAVVLMLVF
jgi:hypothetical protein